MVEIVHSGSVRFGKWVWVWVLNWYIRYVDMLAWWHCEWIDSTHTHILWHAAAIAFAPALGHPFAAIWLNLIYFHWVNYLLVIWYNIISCMSPSSSPALAFMRTTYTQITADNQSHNMSDERIVLCGGITSGWIELWKIDEMGKCWRKRITIIYEWTNYMAVQHVKHADYYLYLFDFLLIALVNEIIVSNWVNPWEFQLNIYAEALLML